MNTGMVSISKCLLSQPLLLGNTCTENRVKKCILFAFLGSAMGYMYSSENNTDRA